ncbi:hypothetical protein HDE_07620 [Halotydeus destructor]|nr:hypothetical protein HDE_07620 [Halotydeus destructor]
MADTMVQVAFHSKLRVLWLSLCVIGNTYQAYTLVRTYLQREVATQVYIQFPETFEPPATTACFSLISMVKLDMAVARWPGLEARLSRAMGFNHTLDVDEIQKAIAKMAFDFKMKLSQYVFDNLEVQDAFALTYQHSDIFMVCRLVRASDFVLLLEPCANMFTITESFKSTSKCFTFKIKAKQVYNYLDLQRVKNLAGWLHGLVMHDRVRNLTEEMTVYYHDEDSYGREGFSRSLLLTPMKLFTTSYLTIDTQLLPAPFASNCQNYTALGFFDRGECFESCVNKLSLDKLGKLSPGPNIFLAEFANERLIDVEMSETNTTIRETVSEINKECDKLCSKPNCKDTYHIPKLMATSNFMFPVLLTMSEQEPNISTTNIQKVGLIECITDLLSSLGFWVGVSGLSLFDVFWASYSSRMRQNMDPNLNVDVLRILT